ncbi:MAG: aromatic amino acid transport family protein [Desulfobulbus sp.]|nr:aromatic amino acid transport family protein [Desulfobulbus sp.]
MSDMDQKSSFAPAPFSDWSWILTLFGTAVGAGILYLPVQVGLTGLWSLAFLSVFLFPLIYFSHKTVVTMLLSEPEESDYANVLARRFGHFFGEGIVIVYFLTFYVLLFSYLVGLTDNLANFLFKLGVTSTNCEGKSWLSLLVVACFGVLYLIGAKVILRVMSAISLALLILLFAISVYLIPFWDIMPYINKPSLFRFADDILLILPILTISFVFFPASSSMVAAFRVSRQANENNGPQCLNRIVLKTTALLLIFVLLFVFSCLLSLPPDAFKTAATTNLNCLALLSAKEGISPIIAKVGPIIGLAALITSFMGVFFAVQESALQLTERFLPLVVRGSKRDCPSSQPNKRLNISVLLSLFVSLWILSLLNPSIMNLFGLVLSPLVAIFLFILPCVVLIRTHGFTVLRKPSIFFVLLTGTLILFSFKLGTLLKTLAG